MWITVGNLQSKLTRYTDHERGWLTQYLTFEGKRRGRQEAKPTCMFNIFTYTFPAGFTSMVQKAAAAEDPPIQVQLIDNRTPPALLDHNADLEWLRDYQRKGVEVAAKRRRGILWLPTGAGKCLAPETLVLLADGGIMRADAVKKGDWLLGPDSKPRVVRSTCSGVGPMYKIIPNKGEPWLCNDAHVLTLVDSATDEVEDIALAEYLAKSAAWKHTRKLFQPGEVCFADAPDEMPIDPYFIGVWLGDGRKDLAQGVQVSKPDAEIERVCRDVAEGWGLEFRRDEWSSCPTYRLVVPRGARRPNPLLNEMRALFPTLRIPDLYLRASVQVRREVLAGLLDTDGHLAKGTYFEITQKCEQLADDIAFLARSLGLRVTKQEKRVGGATYYRLNLLGDASKIPLRLARKMPRPSPGGHKVKDARRVGFRVEAVGDGPYAGFTLDGDGRFLLGDFTVTHNTEIMVGITRALPCRWLALVHRSQLADDIASRWEKRTPGLRAGRVLEGRFDVEPEDQLVACTYQTLTRALEDTNKKRAQLVGEPEADEAIARLSWSKHDHAKHLLETSQGLLVDECHTAPAETFNALLMKTKSAYYRIGLSGTPLARSDAKSQHAIAAIGPVIYKIEPQLLIDRGVLAKPTVRMSKLSQESGRVTWDGVYKDLIVRSKARNALVMKQVARATKPAFVFVEQTEHGKALEKMVFQAGMKASFVWGSHSIDYRKSLIRRLVQGHFDVIVCSRVFNEGIDVPELRAVINAGGMKSIIATLQRLGRGMRVDKDREGEVREGGDVFEVYDVLDEGNKWISQHAQVRRDAYLSCGYETFIE